MNINIHAGHNADGQKGCGAVGYVSESIENRLIKDAVIKYLLLDENIVYDSTVDYAGNQTKNLVEIVKKCNKDLADINVSIHLNAGAKDLDNHTTGTEVYVYDETDITYQIAQRICNNIARLGYCNRGVKVNKNLYVLKNTKAPALLIECFFVDDKNDVDVYQRVGTDKFGKAIAEAIVNHMINDIKTYTVKKGDTLWNIAKEQLGTGTRYKEIVSANNIKNNTIHAGDELVIPN